MKEKDKKLALSEGWISIVINTILFGFKIYAGTVTGSVAIVADAWHTLSDSLTSVIVVIGVKIASKPADKEHPFGHGRAQLIASLVIGILLAIVAVNFATESVKRIISNQQPQFSTLALIVMLISVVVKEAIAQYSFWAARKTGMQSLRADAWHHRSDAIASLFIVIGMLFSNKMGWIDGVLGILVSVLILIVAIEIFKKTVSSLIGEKPDDEIVDTIKSIISTELKEEVYPHHFHLHEYGHHKEITFHIKLPSEMTVFESHRIAHHIEEKICDDLGIAVTIHIDPI